MKLTFISDTHNREPNLLGGDILFHTGDLTKFGTKEELVKQINYLKLQLSKYKHVVLTVGNHDEWAETNSTEFRELCKKEGLILLINEFTTVMNLKIWASPASPVFGNWSFSYRPDEITKIWNLIPRGLDILISHCPPNSILDRTFSGSYAGCPILFDKVLEVKPRIHAFGHIHEAAGVGENDDTVFINSAMSIVNVDYSQDSISYQFQK